jgi:hypothetical protein
MILTTWLALFKISRKLYESAYINYLFKILIPRRTHDCRTVFHNLGSAKGCQGF